MASKNNFLTWKLLWYIKILEDFANLHVSSYNAKILVFLIQRYLSDLLTRLVGCCTNTSGTDHYFYLFFDDVSCRSKWIALSPILKTSEDPTPQNARRESLILRSLLLVGSSQSPRASTQRCNQVFIDLDFGHKARRRHHNGYKT